MSTPFRAQIYRDVAHLLREQAAASTPEIQKDIEATARQYDLLAESVEMSNSQAVMDSRKLYQRVGLQAQEASDLRWRIDGGRL